MSFIYLVVPQHYIHLGRGKAMNGVHGCPSSMPSGLSNSMLSPGSIYTSRQPIHPACQPIFKSLNKVATAMHQYLWCIMFNIILMLNPHFSLQMDVQSNLYHGMRQTIMCMHSCMQGIFPQHQQIPKSHFHYGCWSYFTHDSGQHQASVSKISLDCLLICTRCVYLFFLGSFMCANIEH